MFVIILSLNIADFAVIGPFGDATGCVGCKNYVNIDVFGPFPS